MKTRLPIPELLELEQGGSLFSYRSLTCLSGPFDPPLPMRPINWAGATAQMGIRASYTSEPALITVGSLLSANGIALLDPNGGLLRRLTPAAVALLGCGHYVHDLWVTFADATRWKVFRGPVTVKPTATR